MSWTPEQIQAVWNKGRSVVGYDQNIHRLDQCGAWIQRNRHGSRDSSLGWEIDHIDPNGSNDLPNLRPLQWKNNASRQDGRLTCPVVAEGDHNVDHSLERM